MWLPRMGDATQQFARRYWRTKVALSWVAINGIGGIPQSVLRGSKAWKPDYAQLVCKDLPATSLMDTFVYIALHGNIYMRVCKGISVQATKAKKASR